MKLLHLTNFYPPYALGTPERQCRLIVNELAHRGHFNRVLTSDYTVAGLPDRERFASRRLRIARTTSPGNFARLFRIERQNLATLEEELSEVALDFVIVWTMSGLSSSLLWELERRRIRTIYAVLDHWPRHRLREDPWFQWWTSPLPFWQRLCRRALRSTLLDRAVLRRFPIKNPTDLGLQNAFFASRALRDSISAAGFAVKGSEVIPHCIGREEIPGQPQRRDELRRILWIGRLDTDRDPMTAIQAIQELRHIGQMQFTVDIFGRGDSAFEARLHDYLRDAQLGGGVTIRHASVEEMVALFPTYDMFLYTARYPEPFPLVLLRAMAARLPVIATMEGSNTDLLRGGDNCLLFRTGDPVGCAACIRRIAEDRPFVDALTERAYREVLDSYSALDIAGRVERLLLETARNQDRDLY